MSRAALIPPFLAAAGWKGAERTPLAGDASMRRYERLRHPDKGTAVLMDAPPGTGEDVRPFVAVTGYLRDMGLSAPAILAADADSGLLLIEDLGDDLFARHLESRPADEPLLYGTAVDVLVHIGRQPSPPLGTYTTAVRVEQTALLFDWYLPGATGETAGAPARAEFAACLADCLAAVTGPRVLMLRDYHAGNLVWLPGRSGVARAGLLDYQDACLDHPAYDLASLLEDARRDTSPDLREAMIRRFLDGSGLGEAGLRDALARLAAQRNLRILAVLARLCRRDGKPHYLAYMPRVWDHLMRDLAHPGLAPLAAWVSRHLPPPDAGVRSAMAAA